MKKEDKMAITLEKIHNLWQITEKNFYPQRRNKKNQFRRIKCLFPHVGEKIKKEGKTSVHLVRELREL